MSDYRPIILKTMGAGKDDRLASDVLTQSCKVRKDGRPDPPQEKATARYLEPSPETEVKVQPSHLGKAREEWGKARPGMTRRR